MKPILEAHEFPPPSATVRVDFGAESRCGTTHAVNEDHYLIIRLSRQQETIRTSLPEGTITHPFEEHGYAMVVADGLGGSGTGEVASRLALTMLTHLVRHFGQWNLRINHRVAEEIMERAEQFYRHVDRTIVANNVTSPAGGAQTTLTATFGAGRDLFFAHLGHSRAYLWRDGRLLRLTRDHTLAVRNSAAVPVAPLIDVNATARDLKHILTQAMGIGAPAGPMIDLERVQLFDHDRVLVCTNGLTDAVDESAIGEVLASDRSPDEQCRTLVDLAAAGGGDDDVTALVARYHIPV